jgi:ribonuclease P protein component
VLKAVKSCPLKRDFTATAVINKDKRLGRLTRRAEFLFVREGAYRAFGGLVVQARANINHNDIRVGFTATKKIGNAVARNRAKRRLREIARMILPELGVAGFDYVFIARQGTTRREFTQLLDDARRALLKLAPKE